MNSRLILMAVFVALFFFCKTITASEEKNFLNMGNKQFSLVHADTTKKKTFFPPFSKFARKLAPIIFALYAGFLVSCLVSGLLYIPALAATFLHFGPIQTFMKPSSFLRKNQMVQRCLAALITLITAAKIYRPTAKITEQLATFFGADSEEEETELLWDTIEDSSLMLE